MNVTVQMPDGKVTFEITQSTINRRAIPSKIHPNNMVEELIYQETGSVLYTALSLRAPYLSLPTKITVFLDVCVMFTMTRKFMKIHFIVNEDHVTVGGETVRFPSIKSHEKMERFVKRLLLRNNRIRYGTTKN